MRGAEMARTQLLLHHHIHKLVAASHRISEYPISPFIYILFLIPFIFSSFYFLVFQIVLLSPKSQCSLVTVLVICCILSENFNCTLT